MGNSSSAIAARGPGPLRMAGWISGFVLVALAIWVVGGQRVGLSADIRNYELLYQIAAASDWGSLWRGDDPGFYSLAKLFAGYQAPFETFAIWIAGLTLALKAEVARRLDTNKTILILLYFSYLFWLHEYTQIRLALAMAFILQGIYGRTYYRLLLFIPALLFHGSSAIVIGLYLLLTFPRIGSLALAGAMSLYAILPIVRDFTNASLVKITTYQDLLIQGQFAEVNLFSAMPALQVVTLCLSVLYWRQLGREPRREMIMAGVGVMSFYAFVSVPVLAFRFSELFLVFFVILLSRLWRISVVFKILAAMYVVIAVRTTFISENSLIITS
jgi:hypothetical protein